MSNQCASALHYAAKDSDSSMIEYLIEQGISVNVVDNDNKTPLLWADKPNYVENVTALLKCGADINKVNAQSGACTLYYAAKDADKRMIEFLMEKGISVNVIDKDNKTPMSLADQRINSVECVAALLKYGVKDTDRLRVHSCSVFIFYSFY